MVGVFNLTIFFIFLYFFCILHSENMEHLLCECMALERRRYDILGHGLPTPMQFKNMDMRKIVRFLKDIKV